MFGELYNLLFDGLLFREASFSHVQTTEGYQQVLILFVFGAISKGLGEAGILLINRVSRAEFIRSIVGSAVVLAFAAVVWSGCIWVACKYALGLDLQWLQVQSLVLVSYIPLIFGFLVIIPHVGLLWHRVLMVWGLLIVITGLHYQFGLTLLQGVACSGGGWLIYYVLTYLFGAKAEKIKIRLLGREGWVKPKDAAVALLSKEISEQ